MSTEAIVKAYVVDGGPPTQVSNVAATAEDDLRAFSALGAIVPLYDPRDLVAMYQRSASLRPNVDAYKVNIEGFGYRLEPMINLKAPDARDRIHDSILLEKLYDGARNPEVSDTEIDTRREELDREMRVEKLQTALFFDYACAEMSFVDLRQQSRTDLEVTGNAFWECLRNKSGEVAQFVYVPSLSIRLMRADNEFTSHEVIERVSAVSFKKKTRFRRFRRFVQVIYGQLVCYFKEFGDPRKMDYLTGAFEGQGGYDAKRQATELIHEKNPSTEAYGVPKWINQLPSILGSREAEEVNMRYFQDNTVPPMMLLVGGGRLTTQSYASLTAALNSDNIGKARQNRVMLLEAVGENESLDGKASPIDLKVEKLSDTRQSDGLFAAYDEANMAKVRSSFRLPPITVGMSQDVNFATASTSAFVAESQVFAPARDKRDGRMNKQLINGRSGLNLKTCKLVSRTPSITSPEMLIKSLTALNVMGAVTPRQAQKVANKALQIEMDEYPKRGAADYEEWMDRPIVFVSKQGDPAAAEEETDADGNPITPDGKVGTTHAAQNLKDPATKAVEKDGIVGQRQPKNGSQ